MKDLQKRRPGGPASRLAAKRRPCGYRPLSAAACGRMAAGLMSLALGVNMVQWAWIASLEDARREDAARRRVQLESAERTRDLAVERLGEMVLQAEADKQARAEQA